MASPRGASSAASTSASSDSYQDAVVKIRPSKLFIGGLTQNTTTKQLRDHFLKYGRVLDCIAMRHPDGKARGFGYVTLDTCDAAAQCVSQPQCIDGRVVDVKHAVPGRPQKKEAAAAKSAPTKAEDGACPMCKMCAHCQSNWCRDASDDSSEGSWAWSKPKTGGWRGPWKGSTSWDKSGSYCTGAGATANTKMWNSSWGFDDAAPAPMPPAAGGFYSGLAAPIAPPPGLPMPHGMSLFRTPSPSECSSSRASSPARSEARLE